MVESTMSPRPDGALHELLTPVRLEAAGRLGVIVGRTVPTTAAAAHYDVRVGAEIVTPVAHGALTAIGPCDRAALDRARAAAERAFGDRRARAA